MATERDDAPPTYDLRELGEGLTIYARLNRLADRFLEVAEGEVGRAFARVPAFVERAREEAGRGDEYYRRTTRERYLVELLAYVVMGRQFWPEFTKRRDTVLILPDCLRRQGSACKRKGSRFGTRCTACDPECAICRMTVAAARHGAAAYFSDLEHEKQFRALMRGPYRDLSVLGVACIWMLASGMRAAEAAGVPSQGVLLDFCGCEHWCDEPMVTDAVVEQVEAILAAKAVERARARGSRRPPPASVPAGGGKSPFESPRRRVRPTAAATRPRSRSPRRSASAPSPAIPMTTRRGCCTMRSTCCTRESTS